MSDDQASTTTTEIEKTAAALIAMVKVTRRRQWGNSGAAKTIPWHEQAGEACAAAVLRLSEENRALRAELQRITHDRPA